MLFILCSISVSGALVDNVISQVVYENDFDDDFDAYTYTGVSHDNFEETITHCGDYSLNLSDNSLQYVTTDVPASYYLGNHSIEMWVYPTGWSGSFFLSMTGSDSATGYSLYMHNTGLWYWNENDYDSGLSVPSLNSWQHLLYTFDDDADTVKLYLDSDLIWTKTSVTNLDRGVLWLYTRWGGSYQALEGYVANTVLYDKVLDGSEVNLTYNNGTCTIYTPPTVPAVIENVTPINSTHIDSDINFTFDLSGFIGSEINCTLSTSTIHSTETGLVNGSNTLFYDTSIGIEGVNTVNISCIDSGLSTAEYNEVYFQDTINPNILYINWIEPDGNVVTLNGSTVDANLILNISVNDTNLFSYNFTIGHNSTIDYQNQSINIQTNSANITDNINLGTFINDGLHNFSIEVCDAHTKNDIGIPDIKKFNDEFEVWGVTIGMQDAKSVKTFLESDRISWEFEFNQPKKTVYQYIKTDKDIYYRPWSAYQGHFVIGRQWIDFESEVFEVTTVQEVDDGYIIIMDSRDGLYKDKIKTKSTGLINCINQTVEFTVDDIIEDNVTLTSPVNDYNMTINASTVLLNLTFIPYYSPFNPENCSLNFEDEEVNFTSSPLRNIENTLSHLQGVPPSAITSYTWNVTCRETHLHPPNHDEQHIKKSFDTFTINIENLASTTTTTTTTTTAPAITTTTFSEIGVNEFNSVGQGLFYIMLFGAWIIFLILTLHAKGKRGKTIQFYNIMQMIFAIVIGFEFAVFSYIIAIAVVLTGAGVLFGKMADP